MAGLGVGQRSKSTNDVRSGMNVLRVDECKCDRVAESCLALFSVFVMLRVFISAATIKYKQQTLFGDLVYPVTSEVYSFR